MDVATVIVPITNMAIYYYSVIIVAIIVGIFAFFGCFDATNKKRLFLVCALWIVALICAGIAFAVADDYSTEKQKNLDKTLLRAENIKEQFAEKKYFIREMQQKDSFELSGIMEGGFLLIAGAVYGEIEGAEIKKITLVYNENETQRHYIKTLPLEKLSITTIGKDSSPYFAYSDAYYYIEKVYTTCTRRQCIVKSGEPVLYLPKGWQILGVKM